MNIVSVTTAVMIMVLGAALPLQAAQAHRQRKPTATATLTAEPKPMALQGIQTFSLNTIDGQLRSLSTYAGSVVLIVNVASECGYTYQYKGLEELYLKYKDRGFKVLGMPCDDFGGQEPGTEPEIKAFCERNYQVTFDLFGKLHAKGPEQHPLYAYLIQYPATASKVTWNFNKYLVGKDGLPIHHWASGTKPMDKEITEAVEKALAVGQP